MIDFTKPLQTRDGKKVRLLCADRKDCNWPVIALVESDSSENVECYTAEGHYRRGICSGDMDLINVPVKHKRWVNVYASGAEMFGYRTRDDADKYSTPRRIACIEIEFTEGEGL